MVEVFTPLYQVNCNYFAQPPSQRVPVPDNFCSSYRSEAFDADIIARVLLPPQGPYASLYSNATLDSKYWQDPPLGLYGQ